MPFIFRGIRLIGISTGYSPRELRNELWRRMGDELRPAVLESIARTISLSDLPDALDSFVGSGTMGRIVVDLSR